jgi:hypothetical protein
VKLMEAGPLLVPLQLLCSSRVLLALPQRLVHAPLLLPLQGEEQDHVWLGRQQQLQ